MKVVLYGTDNDRATMGQLHGVISSKVFGREFEVFHSLTNFSKRIRQIPRKIDVAVLLARSRDQLSRLISLKAYLEDIRLILILPDRDRETISKGLLLRPKFVDYLDGNLSNVGAVLEKIFEHIGERG